MLVRELNYTENIKKNRNGKCYYVIKKIAQYSYVQKASVIVNINLILNVEITQTKRSCTRGDKKISVYYVSKH